jgi:hypothetical protein
MTARQHRNATAGTGTAVMVGCLTVKRRVKLRPEMGVMARRGLDPHDQRLSGITDR